MFSQTSSQTNDNELDDVVVAAGSVAFESAHCALDDRIARPSQQYL